MLLLATACDPAATIEGPTTSNVVLSEPVVTTTVTAGTTEPAPGEEDRGAEPVAMPPCASGDVSFSDGGSLGQLGSEIGDATELAAMRWATAPECDRFVIDFVTQNGSPASDLGSTDVTFRPRQGIIRAVLPPEVNASAVADAVVDTALIERAYVVRLLGGNLAVDLHIDGPEGAAVRALMLESPARLVIDLQPGGVTPITPPPRTDRIVVLEPTEGIVPIPIIINGYASPGTTNVTATLPPFAEEAPSARTQPASSTATWGEFAMTLNTAPQGVVELFVGERAAGDGVRIQVQGR